MVSQRARFLLSVVLVLACFLLTSCGEAALVEPTLAPTAAHTTAPTQVVTPEPSPELTSRPTPQPTSAATLEPTPASTPASDEPVTLAHGQFVDIDSVHGGSGTAAIVRLPDGRRVLRLTDFSVTSGPDLYVYLVTAAAPGSGADFGEYVDLGLLQSDSGDQEYGIPEGVTVEQYGSAVIYCLAYSVLFSYATLAP